jgi:peptidoglycan/xylan/chitin deacetylase (PgdA/CDA1 family)
MFLFRPPYGDYDNDVINVAKECGYYPIQWDVDTLVIIKGKGEYLLETKI